MGFPSGGAGNTHDAAQALRHEIVARLFRLGSGLTKSRDRAINQSRMFGTQTRVVQAKSGEIAHFKVFYKHLAFANQPLGQGLTFVAGQIQCDRTFVAVS